MLTRAEIKGFKCLRDVSVELGPFNVLIGPNDSGKSSFLQALGEPSYFARGFSHMGVMSREETSIRLWATSGELVVESMGDQWVVRCGNTVIVPTWPSSRELILKLGDAGKDFFQVSEPVMLEPARIAALSPRGWGALDKLIESRGQGATAHLARVALGDRARYDAIQKGMRDISGGRISEVVVGEGTDSGYPLSFRLYEGTVIPASDVSQGLLLYFAFLTIVHRDDAPAVLLVEEPENGVHPLRLVEVVNLLRALTERGVQIVMTTHSPDLLNACKPEEVLVFRRPRPDSGTEIHRLPRDFERRAMRSTLGEIWASSGEEGLLDMLPEVEPRIQAEAG
jgi:AAA domain, putative AbiEii toxin, Type IV TA system/AAA ATPase domain